MSFPKHLILVKPFPFTKKRILGLNLPKILWTQYANISNRIDLDLPRKTQYASSSIPGFSYILRCVDSQEKTKPTHLPRSGTWEVEVFGEPNSWISGGVSGKGIKHSCLPLLVSFRFPELGRRKVAAAGAEVALMANWGAHCGAEVFFSLWRMLYVRKFVWSSPPKILKCTVFILCLCFLEVI